MYSLVIFLVIGTSMVQAVSYQALVEEQWQMFKLEHGKYYELESEEIYRQSVYVENLVTVTEHNKLYEMGLTSYKMGMNHFGDLTGEEFLRLYTVRMPEYQDGNTDMAAYNIWNSSDIPQDFIIHEPPTEVNVEDLPTDIDWRKKGAVTPVKNQGQCVSGWAFSSTGALEAQWYLKTGNLTSLSEQNLVDCTRQYGNLGCRGGGITNAFLYVQDNGGIDTEDSYRYEARVDNCRYNPKNKEATVSQVVQFKGEDLLQEKVSSVGPIAVFIEVRREFQMYHSGVYDDPGCGNTMNHVVLVVGFGSEDGKDYWLVKNSWGPAWGDQGYIKMSRNKNNQCGIANYPTYPIV